MMNVTMKLLKLPWIIKRCDFRLLEAYKRVEAPGE